MRYERYDKLIIRDCGCTCGNLAHVHGEDIGEASNQEHARNIVAELEGLRERAERAEADLATANERAAFVFASTPRTPLEIAAPELAEALELVMPLAEARTTYERALFEKARAALRKAGR